MNSDQPELKDFGWAVLELMGHRRMGGVVREELVGGVPVLRIDVPGPDGEFVATQWYGAQALYCLTPVSEEAARAVAYRNQPEPVTRWDLPAPAPAKKAVVDPAILIGLSDEDDEDDEDDDEDCYYTRMKTRGNEDEDERIPF